MLVRRKKTNEKLLIWRGKEKQLHCKCFLSNFGMSCCCLLQACAPRYVFHTMQPRKVVRVEPVGTCYMAKKDFKEFTEYSPCRTSKWNSFFYFMLWFACGLNWFCCLCINGNVLIDAIATTSFRFKSSTLLHSLIPIPMLAFFFYYSQLFLTNEDEKAAEKKTGGIEKNWSRKLYCCCCKHINESDLNGAVHYLKV